MPRSWFGSRKQAAPKAHKPAASLWGAKFRPVLEALEDRSVPASLAAQSTIASSASWPATTGTHFHSQSLTAVGSYSSSEEERGTAEFNISTDATVASLATLTFQVTRLGGSVYGQSGPGNYTVNVIAYAGNNANDLSDFSAPQVGAVVGSFNTAGLTVGQTFSFNATNVYNTIKGSNPNSIGFRLQAVTNPGSHVDNEFGNFALAVQAGNTPPSNVIVNNATVTEGTSFNLTGSFTDPDAGDIHRVTITWGDGTPNTVLNLAAGVTNFSAPHIYADDPTTPPNTPTGTYTVSVLVEEVPLQIDFSSGSYSDRNPVNGVDTYSEDGFIFETEDPANHVDSQGAGDFSFHDGIVNSVFDNWIRVRRADGAPFTLTNFQVTNLGGSSITFMNPDGQSFVVSTTGTVTPPVGQNWSNITSFRMSENGNQVLVHLDDFLFGGNGSATGTGTITVNNAAPVVNAGGNTTINEGSTLTRSGSFTDLGFGPTETWTAEVNYGEGAGFQALPLSGQNFSLSNLYEDNGVYTVTVRVRDDDMPVGTFSTATFQVTVNNLAPVLTAPTNQTANEGASTSFNLGSFTDAGVNDNPWTVNVNWGDTTSGSFQVASQGALSRNHTYADNGTFTVTVTVTDKDNAISNAITFQVTVSNLAPILTAPGNQSAPEGTSTSFNLGSFTDAGVNDSPWTVNVNWGDTTSDTFQTNAQGALTFNHTYADNGTYTVTATVTDKDSGVSNTVTFQVAVANVAPTITAFNATSGLNGNTAVACNPVTFQISLTDPSPVDTANPFVYEINWGDGTPNQFVTGGTSITVTHSFDNTGSFTPMVRASDKDAPGNNNPGAWFNASPAPINVTVVQMIDGNLVIAGSNGNDNISVNTYNPAAVMVTRNSSSYNFGPFNLGEGGRVIIRGCDGIDTITVNGPVSAEIYGGNGNDFLYGGSGNDVIFGEAGDDYVSLGAGDDVGIGGFGRDNIFGGNGDDVLVGGHVDSQVYGWGQLQQVVTDWKAWNNQGTPPATLTALRDATTDPADAANVDKFYGNTGKDLFIYRSGSGGDTVNSFSLAERDYLLALL
jgi:hypothetical protein